MKGASNRHPLFLLISALLMLVPTHCALSWVEHPDIRTGNAFLINTLKSNSSTAVSYNISYSSALSSGTAGSGLGLTGYYTYITNDFSVNTSITNYTSSWLRITAQVLDTTTVIYLSVNWIVTGDTVDFLQILNECFLCSTLSTSNGSRSETRTATTYFVGYEILTADVFLSGFRVHNSDGITNQLASSASITSFSSQIDYTFSTYENNTVTSICYTTLVYCKQLALALYYNYVRRGQQALSDTILPSTNLEPMITAFQMDYKDVNRQFYGINSFNVTRSRDRQFKFNHLGLQTGTNPNTYDFITLDTGYSANVGCYEVKLSYFLVAVRECDNSEWFYPYDTYTCENDCTNQLANSSDVYESSTGDYCALCDSTCLTCSGPEEDKCQSCNQTLFRENTGGFPGTCTCEAYYLDIGVDLCYACSAFIPGCLECSSTTLCTTCDSGYVKLASGLCGCTEGFLVSGICTNITGCTSMVEYSATSYCIECNSTLYYQRTSSYTCECMPSYYLSANDDCLSQCGDGLQSADQGCDDGNTASGDGCSSTCVVETNWACFNGSTTRASSCLIDNMFTITVRYVRRLLTGNIMRVQFLLSPLYDEFSNINFADYITHNVPVDKYNASYVNDRLLVDFYYNETIEGQEFTFALTLDPTRFYSSTASTTIPASGMNAKLTYDKNYAANQPLSIIVIVLCACAIIVLALSVVSERMIGIEMIQTLQACLFTQMVIKTMPSSLAPLENLQYASGYNHIMGTDHARTYTFAFSLSSVGLQKQFLLSYNLMYIVLLLVVIVCLFLKAKQLYYEGQAQKLVEEEDLVKNQVKLEQTTTAFNFVFERVLFVAAFMSMFLVIAAIMTQLTDMSPLYTMMGKELNLLGAGVAVAIIITLVGAVIINGIYPETLIFPMLVKQYYPPVYFIYQSAFIFICSFMYTQEYILYILGGMSIGFLIYIAIHRPYPEKIHTFVLIFHQAVIILFILLLMFEVWTTPTENETIFMIAAFAIVIALFAVVFLNAYRLWRYRKFLEEREWDEYGNQINPEDDLRYEPLKTPKERNKLREQEERNELKRQKLAIKEEKKRERAREKKAEKERKRQMEELEERNRKSRLREKEHKKNMKELEEIKQNKNKPPVDDSEYKWKKNQLAEEAPSRAPPTKREAYPDTAREAANVNDYGKKAGSKPDNSKVLSESKTVKNLQQDPAPRDLNNTFAASNNPNNPDNSFNQSRQRPSSPHKNRDDQESGNIDEQINGYSPYDEYGFVSSRANKSPQNRQELDPLKLIKMRMKEDFTSKMKSSTIKEE